MQSRFEWVKGIPSTKKQGERESKSNTPGARVGDVEEEKTKLIVPEN